MSDHSAEARPLPEVARWAPRRQLVVVALVAVAILAIALLASAVRALTTPKPVEPKPLPAGVVQLTPEQWSQVKAEPAGFADPGEVVPATGVISVDQTRSTPVLLNYSGQVAQVFVEAGDRVGRGQPLLRIASADLVDATNASLAARAQQATAAAQLSTAQAAARRQEEVFRTAGGAEKDYRQAQADLVAAQSAKRAADAAVAAAGNKLALFGGRAGGTQVIYRAPVGGTIATRDVAVGQYVGAGGDKPLLTIADLSRVWLVAQLPEQLVGRVRRGDQVAVTTPAYPGRSFAATIDNVAAGLDPMTRRLSVRASVSNPDNALKPGMSASFVIRPASAAGESVIVPSRAVIYEGDDARVWVLRADRRVVARPVKTGETVNGYTRITAGLSANERVVTTGALFVNEAGLGE